MITMALIAVALAGEPDPTSALFESLIATSTAGAVLVLMMFGWLSPRPHINDLRAEADAWRVAYENEREARLRGERTGEVAIEQGKLAITLLTELNNQRSRGR